MRRPPSQWETFLTEELALRGDDPQRADRGTWPGHGRRSFRCAVIGAGASGLAAAHRLAPGRLEVTVLEKNTDVGGTWLENVYPGCRVDVPNQLYSFSFAQTNDWVSRFSAQPDLLAYLHGVAKELGLGECIRFGCEVTEARFDEHSGHVAARPACGRRRRPPPRSSTPWSARWASSIAPPFRPSTARTTSRARRSTRPPGTTRSRVAGRRVAVIGTGASAAQFVPCIVDDVAHLDVYQRTPPWLLPTENYGDPFPAEFLDLLTLAAGLRPVGPFVAVLDHARGTARARPGWIRTGTGTPRR